LNPSEKEKCYNQGGLPGIKKDARGCEHYTCDIKVTACVELPEDELSRQKNKCVVEYNGEFKIKTDAQGCTYTDCVLTQPVTQTCMNNEDVKISVNKCVMNNGAPNVKSEEGCVKEVSCTLKRDYEEPTERPEPRVLPPEERKDHNLGKLFNVAFKLEEVRMQFDVLKRKTAGIATYYEEQGDLDYAKKFNTVSLLLEQAIGEVDTVKTSLRDKIDSDEVDIETFASIKESLNGVKNNMKNVLKELLR